MWRKTVNIDKIAHFDYGNDWTTWLSFSIHASSLALAIVVGLGIDRRLGTWTYCEALDISNRHLAGDGGIGIYELWCSGSLYCQQLHVMFRENRSSETHTGRGDSIFVILTCKKGTVWEGWLLACTLERNGKKYGLETGVWKIGYEHSGPIKKVKVSL